MHVAHTATSASTRMAPPPNPLGWYCVAFTDELKPGQILERRLAGHEIVLWRTQTGRARVSDAYCPHLGAHFAKGGEVKGQVLRCPFHGFCFDAEDGA